MDSFIEEILVSNKEIVDICEKIGKRITDEYKDKKPLLIGLLKGCVPFMAELMKHIKCDMEIDFMHVSSYAGTHSTGAVTITKDLTTNLLNRHVIIVEDVVDSGLTLKQVMCLFRDRKASSIEIAALLDKPSGRTVEGLFPKYVGKVIPNKFVVGFGLDYDGLYRNLDYVGVLKKSVYEK